MSGRAPLLWAGENRLTEIRPRRLPVVFSPVDLGLRVRRIRLRPSSGVHFVTQVATREGGLFGDSDPVVVSPLNKFDCDAFNGDAVA